MNELTTFIIELIQKHPHLGSLAAIVGGLRITMKPIMLAVRAVVKVTPTKRDDELLEKFEESKWWAAFQWVVNWLGSVELPPRFKKK